jgi:segregation and condensation protein B
MDKNDRQKVLELLLWLADRPLKPHDIQSVLEGDAPTDDELREELLAYAHALDERGAPMQLVEIAQGWQLASRPAFSQWVRRLFKEKTTLRLSPSALETLSIIAYKQPLTRGDIEEIRGVDVGGVLETLLERKLIKIVGRKEALGRPLLYGTTPDFMRQFGLKSLDELPKLEELVPPEEGTSVPPAAAPTETAESAVPAGDGGAPSASQ